MAVDRSHHDQPLTLRKLLERPLFARARVLAGAAHLDSPVRWVHVGEIVDVASYLHGSELILCTGVAIRTARDWRLYLESLASRRVAAVCIELGEYVGTVPDSAVRLAERLGLPLIAFLEPVRFVDITRDIHALLVQGERDALAAVHALGETLRRLTPGPDSVSQVLRRLAEWLDRPLAFRTHGGEPMVLGRVTTDDVWRHRIGVMTGGVGDDEQAQTQEVPLPDGGYLVRRHAAVMGLSLGAVSTWCSEAERVYVAMAVDMAATAIAQELFRQRTVAEERLRQQQSLLRHLLAGQCTAVRPLWEAAWGSGSPTAAQVLVLEDAGSAFEGATVELHTVLRERFLRRGYRVLFAADERRTIAVLPVAPTTPVLRDVLMDVLRPGPGLKEPRFGVGRPGAWERLGESYREADLALSIGRATGWSTDPFYAALGVYRLLFNLRRDFDLRGFVEDELGGVLAYDRAHGTELLRTLGALLASAGRKELAAGVLCIHRQTLYYRIGKLQALLGSDFLTARRRTAIDVAMVAERLLRDREPVQASPSLLGGAEDLRLHPAAGLRRRSVHTRR